jgi:hypothetical protein
MSIQIAQHMIAMVIVAGLAYGQTTPKTFDVATIKPSANDDGRFALRNPPGGNFVAIGVPLRMLIMQAYDVQAFEVSGGPSWVPSQGGGRSRASAHRSIPSDDQGSIGGTISAKSSPRDS